LVFHSGWGIGVNSFGLVDRRSLEIFAASLENNYFNTLSEQNRFCNLNPALEKQIKTNPAYEKRTTENNNRQLENEQLPCGGYAANQTAADGCAAEPRYLRISHMPPLHIAT